MKTIASILLSVLLCGCVSYFVPPIEVNRNGNLARTPFGVHVTALSEVDDGTSIDLYFVNNSGKALKTQQVIVEVFNGDTPVAKLSHSFDSVSAGEKRIVRRHVYAKSINRYRISYNTVYE